MPSTDTIEKKFEPKMLSAFQPNSKRCTEVSGTEKALHQFP